MTIRRVARSPPAADSGYKDAIALQFGEPHYMKSTLCLLLASLMTTTPPPPLRLFRRMPPSIRMWSRRRSARPATMTITGCATTSARTRTCWLPAGRECLRGPGAALKPLEDTLYKEIVGRIKQDDSSVPARERGYWYWPFRDRPGLPHPRTPQGQHGVRGNPAGRQYDGCGQGLLQRRLDGGQPGQPVAGLGR